MKTIAKLALTLALAFGLAAAVSAGEEKTLTGEVMCAKCSLKKAGAEKCQDVLVTKDDAGKTTEYYIEKTEAAKAFGHVCENQKAATVTGTVSEKDGKMWISPSKIEDKSS